MRRIGKYQYADSGKTLVLTAAGLETTQVRKAFLQLDDPNMGLGKVPASWVDNGWIMEVVKGGR